MSPGLKSTNLYGPVPTGERLVGASRDLAPRNASKRCFGMMQPRLPTNGLAQNGVVFWKTMRTVWLSTFSVLQSLYALMVTQEVAGSAAYSQLNTTSSAVKGLPACHVTLRFSFQTS